jgi:transposase-like protein
MKPAVRALPVAQVQISLPVQGVLRDVRHAFLGLCIDAGQRVLAELMESDRIALCGPKRVPDAERRAVRGGSASSKVVLGGQRIAIRRPRARSTRAGELCLPTFEWAAGSDPLDAATMAAIAAGVSTRRYASTQEPVPAAHRPRAASKSAVSRRFVQLSQEQLTQWLARPLGELDLAAVMIDGIHFRDRVILLALGIDAQGNKHVLGLREGSTEATRVVASLLSDLVDRGLDAQRMRLWVIDGGKALRKAIVQTFGATALIQRCQEHKRRNVLEHLPEDMHASVKRALKDAWSVTDAELARRQLNRLASSLQARHPGAAANLTEEVELTRRYADLCRHYGMRASRCNPGESHENGSIESRNHSLKTALDQALRLRGSRSFDDRSGYEAFVSEIVQRFNARVARRLAVERAVLKALPARRTAEYEELPARVPSHRHGSVNRVNAFGSTRSPSAASCQVDPLSQETSTRETRPRPDHARPEISCRPARDKRMPPLGRVITDLTSISKLNCHARPSGMKSV